MTFTKFFYSHRTNNHTNRVFTIRTCCEGYVGMKCEKTRCTGLKCGEDPNSKCVVIERCGVQFPVFFNRDGLVSENCKPELAKPNLCPNDICQANLVCPGLRSEGAICLGSGMTCDCSPKETWFLEFGQIADCNK